MITSFLPTFKVFEVNNLTGLRNGHILAQMKADVSKIAKKAAGDGEWIENSIIVGLDADGTISNYDAAKHPRCIGLYIGDTFTTNNYTGEYEGAKYAKVVNGVLELQAEATADSIFKATPTTMPDGEEGVEFQYYGKV